MPLSDLSIRNKKPAAKVLKLSDGGGLQLHVMPTGSKLWRLAYRFEGRQKTLAIGPYPEVGLIEARERREDAKKLLRAGADPSQQKRAAKVVAASENANTFGAVADELRDKKRREGKSGKTLAKVEWLLGIAKSDLGARPINQITPADVLAVLRPVEVSGRLETARRLRSLIGETFRFAIATARATTDPTYALKGALAAPTVRHHAAITDPVAFGGLLRAIESSQGQPATRAALKLMALLFPRPGELRLAEWPEFDLDAAVWLIPAARTKMRRPHRVPLPRQAIDVLRDLHAITGRGKLVFPGVRTIRRPISDNTLNAALRRLGFAEAEHSAHGFRATASTLLNESGKFSADAIERALAHVDRDDVRRAYARGAHWEERVRMAQYWADRLDALRDGGKIIAISRNSGAPAG